MRNWQGTMDPDQTVDTRYTASVDRLLREAQIQAAFTSPHVVRLLDSDSASSPAIGSEFETPYLVMGHLAGGDLQARIGVGLAPRVALLVLRDLCEVLNEAYALGGVNRGIKPGNVLFRADVRYYQIVTSLDRQPQLL